MNYILVDTANTFFRSKFAIQSDLDSKIGMVHILHSTALEKYGKTLKVTMLYFVWKEEVGVKIFYEPTKETEKTPRDVLQKKK